MQSLGVSCTMYYTTATNVRKLNIFTYIEKMRLWLVLLLAFMHFYDSMVRMLACNSNALFDVVII